MCEKNPCIKALILSILIGIGLAVVYSFGFIVQTAVLLWVSFGFATTVLFTILFILTMLTDERGSPMKKCLCRYGGCMLAGVFGTIVSAIAGLAITLVPTGAVSIVIFFLIGTFLTLTLVSLLQFICCTLREICCR